MTSNKKLVRAKELIDGLGGEQARWTEKVGELAEEYTNLTGNVPTYNLTFLNDTYHTYTNNST